MLDVIGLGAEAQRIYELLIGLGSTGADELAAASGLSAPRVREILGTLEGRGLARCLRHDPLQYAAVDPGTALDVLLLRREEEIKHARIHAQELSKLFHEAADRQAPAQLVEVVAGRETVRHRVDSARRSARQELRIFDKPPYAIEPTPDVAEATGSLLIERGGRVRTIFDQAALELPGRLAGDIGKATAKGVRHRVLPELPMKLVLVDDRLAIVPLQATPAVLDSAVFVYRSGLLEALSALFETLWHIALPLDPAHPGADEPEQPSEDERHLLKLLSTGVPDEAIARALGLSERTCRRRIHYLMERLNARTRFQLARQAARRGWLNDAPD
ncbi:DNA-binding CsgD family transcriptional regulator [Nonomuraea thailandensis]|uniref:DNA-binding CsgD family transcriptional regulator n=1 Tax=Nonomuraea thailandensis TaxID=1188745 RepID=A0A9X2GSL2_9ACTN|nr:LuxR family transcriptional regulator [Nonomuraea thailandensis]MCP2363240.1 DNA-binding CsgD family transcriptional regulator [Nonomuraea thailandensis]